ncbi:hypothetical protein EJV46_10950 [Roseococcus sp. SYP-B2431]|uniref:hypothetical protein n=1 Tax=Roseococcus sp. SYP-B2431 TaxID=2496640 RepID=UPI001040B4BA|nr:hypothetical protein [Roseococcus sp. SYP-B2431]TCH99051.1 hypothetical protein EJV46_10950 [Roseococcus sp. SYP-B2431]
MWDFSVGRALGLMARTAPFIVFRMMVYAGIAAAYVIATGVGAGLGWLIGAAGSADFRAAATGIGGFAGFGLVGAVLYMLREYLLYVVKAGHIAVLVEVMEGRPIPMGRAQIDHASAMVRRRFAEANTLFAMDLLIKGVLGVIMGLIQGIANLLPIPGLDGILGFIRAVLRVSLGFMDEVILAHIFRTNPANSWEGGRQGLVLYAQNGTAILRNAAFLTFIIYGLTFVIFLLMLAPAAAVAYALPGGWSAGGIVFALLFAWAVKAALIEPFAIACMMQAFFKVSAGQGPDPAWDARLASASGKFQELRTKAMGWAPRPAT